MYWKIWFFVLIALICSICPAAAEQQAGSVGAWGANYEGQTNTPDGDDFVQIAAGGFHSLALKSDGSLVGWGWNYYGQTDVPAGNDFVAVAAGEYHSLALKSDGSLVGWGWNYYGQTDVPAGNDFVGIAAGGFHSLALKSDGSLVGWGWNYYGQIDVPAGNDFVAIAAGSGHSLALRSDGSLVAWGGYEGQTDVPAGNDFVAIAAGSGHNVALKSDGSLVAWGWNDYGQTDVPGGNDFVAISAGRHHSLALKSDGSLVGWGWNDYGQTDVPPGNDFVAIAAGATHSVALTHTSAPAIDPDPNDQISEPVAKGSVPPHCSHRGLISPDTDVDMFSFSVTAGSTIAIDIDLPSESGLDPYIRLFKSDGTQLAFSNDAAAPGESPSTESYLEYTFATAGTYYVGVSSNPNSGYDPLLGTGDVPGSTGEYVLRLSEVDSDLNDQIGESVAKGSVPPNRSHWGLISPESDVDMFSFTVTAGTTIAIDIDLPSDSELDSYVRLFKSDGTQVKANNDGAAPGEIPSSESYLEHTFATSGTYYVGVSSNPNGSYDPVTGTGDVSGGTGRYVLHLREADSDPNDQISEPVAKGSVPPSRSHWGVISPDADVDMFSFSVSAGSTIAIDIDLPSGSGLDPYIRLFKSDGTQLAFSNDAAAPGESPSTESYLEYTFATAGTYYVGVSGNLNNSYDPVTGTGDVPGTTGDYLLYLRSSEAAVSQTLGLDPVPSIEYDLVEDVFRLILGQ